MNYIQFIYQYYKYITLAPGGFMKKLLMLAVLVSGNLWAGERVILKDSKIIEQEVSNDTVRCSPIGYGMFSELKINMQALDGWTLFDHTNISFGDKNIACMTAGKCKGPAIKNGFDLDDLIQSNPRVERVEVHREVVEVRTIIESANSFKICQRRLVENLKTNIGGIKFTHTRGGAEQDLPEDACFF